MAKLRTPTADYREDLSEMPDGSKKKTCPNRDKYLSGKRILPKKPHRQGETGRPDR